MNSYEPSKSKMNVSVNGKRLQSTRVEISLFLIPICFKMRWVCSVLRGRNQEAQYLN